MSEKLRSVNTKFWDDPFIEELSPSEKLLFLYLLTNPLANILGIYEITIKRICYDTGLNKDIITKGLERFGTVRKAFYNGNYIILPNWLKNQRLNKNMKIAVNKEFNKLPTELKNSILKNGSEGLGNGSEGFETLMECLDKYEEGKRKEEEEDEIEKGSWRKDFNIYVNQLNSCFNELKKDKEFILTQEKFNPNVDIILSIEKAITNYWGTEAGWKHKKQSRSVELDWKATLTKAIDYNKVYKQKSRDEQAISAIEKAFGETN